jgi:hypothetical protein
MIGMGRACIAIDAAMLASAIGVDRFVEGYVGDVLRAIIVFGLSALTRVFSCGI